MSALPTPQPAYRYAAYIEELHEFFADHHLYFGVSTDIVPLVERLEHPGPVRNEWTAIVLSILAREGGTVPTAELLEIVAIAIGGSRIFEPSPELNQPISRLYDVINGILALPRSTDSEPATGEVVSFPSKRETEPLPPDQQVPVLEPDVLSSPRPRRRLHFGASTIDLPYLPTPGPSFRKLLIAAAVAVVVAVVLAIALRPRSSALRSTVIHAVGATTVAHPAKPSPYGPAFTPTPPPRKHPLQPKSPTDPTQSAGGTSVAQPADAAR